jgi:hypothetical protein
MRNLQKLNLKNTAHAQITEINLQNLAHAQIIIGTADGVHTVITPLAMSQLDRKLNYTANNVTVHIQQLHRNYTRQCAKYCSCYTAVQKLNYKNEAHAQITFKFSLITQFMCNLLLKI